jgi:hypothetical protein
MQSRNGSAGRGVIQPTGHARRADPRRIYSRALSRALHTHVWLALPLAPLSPHERAQTVPACVHTISARSLHDLCTAHTKSTFRKKLCLYFCLPPDVGLPRYWLSAPKVTLTVDSLQVCLRRFQLSAEPPDFFGWVLGVLLPAWLDQFTALVDW